MLASFLIPWGVILYTSAGGLKATFMASYLHTTIIFGILITMMTMVYIKVYSSDQIFDFLDQTVSYTAEQCTNIYSENGDGVDSFYLNADGGKNMACGPVKGNFEGSYLTMLSGDGLMFGIINIVGNFGTVFVDQSYWQSAIAARPSSAAKGYLLGGICWFAIPFSLATSLGRPPPRPGRLRPHPHHALHGHRVDRFRREHRRVQPHRLRHLPRVLQPRGHWQADPDGIAHRHRGLRHLHGALQYRPQSYRPQSWLGLPLHGHLHWQRRHSSLEHDDLGQGLREGRRHRRLVRPLPRRCRLAHRGQDPERHDFRGHPRDQRGHALRQPHRHPLLGAHPLRLLQVHRPPGLRLLHPRRQHPPR